MEIPIEELQKLLKPSDGPLKHVENIKFPEPWLRPSMSIRQPSSKRGPKSREAWVSEIRKVWSDSEGDVDLLGKSWLANLPYIRKLGVKYGPGLTGRGKALKEILARALVDARQYHTDEKTHAMLIKYPEENIEAIAKGCDISREQFSRQYCPKAAKILTACFQHLIGRKSKSQAQ